jgi:hypothetical protein
MLTHKGELPEGFVNKGIPPIAGHIASFSTDENCDIDLVMSLRSNKLLKKDALGNHLKVHGELIGVKLDQYLFGIEFVSLENEFKSHFFGKDIKTRLLFGIPMNAEQRALIKHHVEETKKGYKDGNYILIDGTVNDIYTHAINCCTGFLSGNNLRRGDKEDPSPQLTLWSFLRFVLGEELRDKLIVNTNIKDGCIFTEDDNIDWLDSESGKPWPDPGRIKKP